MSQEKIRLSGELTLIFIIIINSLGVVLMLHSGSGISAISSVPYAFSEVFPFLTLGTWNYLFQSALVLTLMILSKRIVVSYLFSFVVGFAFGIMMDIHELWVGTLPKTLPLCILYFIISYFLLTFGVALSNRCKMPIAPTDLFSRELEKLLHIPYARIKTTFDLLCISVTCLMTFFFLDEIKGLGFGTLFAAFTFGKVIERIGKQIDRYCTFYTYSYTKRQDI